MNRGLVGVAIAALLMALSTIACSQQSSILGRWQATDRPWNIEFLSNGTIYMSTIGPAKKGTYRVDSNSVLFVDLDDGGRFKATISQPSSDELVLTDQDRTFTRFRRVR